MGICKVFFILLTFSGVTVIIKAPVNASNEEADMNLNKTPFSPSGIFSAAAFSCAAAAAIFFCGAQPANACTDVLNAFLSVEKLNEKVKDSLLKINDAFQRLDVALSQKDGKTAQGEVGKLIDAYFDFYLNHFQNPPAQFVDDPKWRDKLTDVNSKIKVILTLVNQGRHEDAHTQVQAAYNSFSAIYIDRIPMQEQNVFDLIKSRIDSIEVELAGFVSEQTSETAIHANNIKSLAERLLSFKAPDARYSAERESLVSFITKKADYIMVNPPRDTASCELLKPEAAALRSSVEVFIRERKTGLNKEWFKQ